MSESESIPGIKLPPGFENWTPAQKAQFYSRTAHKLEGTRPMLGGEQGENAQKERLKTAKSLIHRLKDLGKRK